MRIALVNTLLFALAAVLLAACGAVSNPGTVSPSNTAAGSGCCSGGHDYRTPTPST